jgi:nitrate reductase beta subunit
MAQMAMVMNLDKCNRLPHLLGDVQAGVDQPQRRRVRLVQQRRDRPGQGYPRTYQDQERWKGGWTLNGRGRLRLKGGGAHQEAAHHLLQPR